MWSPTHVQIVVQRARNVIAKGKNGTNDSYVIIQNGKEKFQTSVKEQSIDPVWHEECDLPIEDKETDVIKLIVFHRNLFGLADEFLGQALVALKDFDIYERPKSRWYELDGRSHKSSKKYRGEIEVRVMFIVKNIPNDHKLKKRNSLVHHSLLDIRGALKSDPKGDRHEPKHNINGRKFSMADSFNKMPKLATRSISFKLESFNTRRKSLVDKFLGHKRRDSTSQESDSQYKVEEESLESNDFSQRSNGVINEEMSQSQEEVRQLGKNCKNKIVIEVKNEINSEPQNSVEENVEIIKTNNEVKDNQIVNDLADNETQTIKASEQKSSSWKPLKGSLKRAFSTSNLLFMNSSNKPVPKLSRERSSTTTLTTTSSKADNPSPQKLSQFHGPKITPNNKTYSAFINNEAIYRQTHTREKLLSALKNTQRRHTIDFDEILPNLKHPNFVLEKRATQASPDSLYSSFESLIHRKHSKTDYHQKYEGLNKEELIQLIENQQLTILGLNEQINDLEQYIDNLLVRVIETSPRLLQSSCRVESLYKI